MARARIATLTLALAAAHAGAQTAATPAAAPAAGPLSAAPAAAAPAAAAPAAAAPAAAAPATGPALSLGNALNMAKGYEARYLAAQAGFRADREILDQTRGLLLPEISASANRTHNDLTAVYGTQQPQSGSYYSGSSSISLRQPIYRPESWARYRQAKSEVSRLEAVLDSDRNKLAIDLSAAYLEVLRAQTEFRSYQAQQLSQQGQAAAAARGVPLGLVSASERDERQARSDLAALRTVQAKAKLVEARHNLEKMVGQPVTTLLALEDANLAPQALEIEDLPVWLDRIANGSPEVRAARAAVEVAREGVDRAEAGHLPTVDLLAGRSKSESDSFTSINNTYYNTSVGVQLTVPIYSGGRVSSGVRQAVAQLEKAQAQLELAQRETAVLVEREHLTVRQAVHRLRAHDALVASATQNLVSARQGVERGNRSQLDVLEAQGLLQNAQYERAGARLELLAARVRLQSLAGEVDAATVARLDALLTQPVAIER